MTSTGVVCGDGECALCAMMNDKIDLDWCFEWLRHLKDFEASQELAEKDRQVLLMVKQSDNEVRHIRTRLAFLQTQTVDHSFQNKRFKFSAYIDLFCVCSLSGH
jgi:hypothetical protein